MPQNSTKVSLDILIIQNKKVLLGLLSKNWLYEGKQVYGVPGREIYFREKIGEAVKRDLKDELDVEVINYRVISVNANYAMSNHYLGIGVLAEIKGEVKLSKPDDWEKWEWFEINKIPNNLFPAAKNIIQSYKENKFCVSE